MLESFTGQVSPAMVLSLALPYSGLLPPLQHVLAATGSIGKRRAALLSSPPRVSSARAIPAPPGLRIVGASKAVWREGTIYQ